MRPPSQLDAGLRLSADPPGAAWLAARAERILRSRRCAALAPYLCLLLFTLAVLWPAPWLGVPYWGDLQLYFEPMYGFAHRALLAGRIPLWNPYVLGGQPFAGNPQISLFYPTSILIAVLPAPAAVAAMTRINLFAAGGFCYAYLRRWTRTPWGALAGAITFAGAGAVLGRAQFPPMLQTIALFPACLLAVDLFVDGRRRTGFIAVALVVALSILAAHAQVTYLSLFCAASYATSRVGQGGLRAAGSRPANSESAAASPSLLISRVRALRASTATASLVTLAGAAALGVFLASVQLLPAAQLFVESPREAMSASQANRFVLEPQHLLTLVAPRFFGHPASGDFWGGGNAWEQSIFVGWASLALAAWACIAHRRRLVVRFWAIALALALWLALGSSAGLFWLAFYVVPGVSAFHDPARFLLVAVLAFAVLAGLGFDTALGWYIAGRPVRSGAAAPRFLGAARQAYQAPLPAWPGALLLAAVALPLLWYGRDWNPAIAASDLESGYRQRSHIPQVPASTWGGLSRDYSARYDLIWDRFLNYADYGPSDQQTVSALTESLAPNLGMGCELADASGYEPVPIKRAADLDGLNRRALKRGEPNLPRLLRLGAVRSILLPVGAGLSSASYMAQPERAPVRAFASEAQPADAWVVHRTRRIDGDLRTEAAIAAPQFDPLREAIVESDGAAGSELDDDAQIVAASPAVSIGAADGAWSVDTGSAPGTLVVASTAYPGWSAVVDGHAHRARRVDGALLGVFLGRGRHQVRFVYAPDVFRVGLYMTCLALAGLAAGLSLMSSGRKRPTLQRTNTS